MYKFSSFDEISAIDSQNMFDILKAFPNQVIEAVNIGNNSNVFKNKILSKNFAVLGMGGSAIGGDILSSYLSNTIGAEELSINTYRNYRLPGSVSTDTNIIASSYSGGTEETISSLTSAIEKCNNILCISAGGKLSEIADSNYIPVIKIPAGMQPRCALGYSFFPMLQIVLKTGLLNDTIIEHIKNEINEVIEILQNKSNEYSEINESNSALNLAKKIFGSIPLIYSSVDGMESVNTRWVRQIQENAKHLVFSGLLPEMNHNEINSFSYPVNIPKEISMIFIRDKNDHPKTQIRFNALASLTGESVKQVIEVQSNAESLLARMFDMIYLGDWVSYYLAILSKVDPTPIPLITKLKSLLA